MSKDTRSIIAIILSFFLTVFIVVGYGFNNSPEKSAILVICGTMIVIICSIIFLNDEE